MVLDARLEALATAYYSEGLMTRPEYLAGRAAFEAQKACLPVPIVRPHELTTGAMLSDAWTSMAVSVQRTVLDDILCGSLSWRGVELVVVGDVEDAHGSESMCPPIARRGTYS